MGGVYFLIPLGLVLGLVGLGAFLWSLRTGQYDDLQGAAERILLDEDDAGPAPEPTQPDEQERSGETR